MQSKLTIALIITTYGCAAAGALGGTALLKAPIEKQCSGYGLAVCPELVDGVLLYVDGDRPEATKKLRRAASKNTPEQLRLFAKALAVTLPRESNAGIVAILTGEIETSPTDATGDDASIEVADSTAVDEQPRSLARIEHVQLALAAHLDPSRMTTDSTDPLTDPDREACEVAGNDALCVKVLSGPLVVTDAVTPSTCVLELVIGAADSNGRLAWVAPTNAPGLHGTRFFVRSNQWLTIAAQNTAAHPEAGRRCFVTWAGFRPRIVPPNL